jgi:hypothetical protein
MRITNIDTLSAYLDRLITENIKLFFFIKENKLDRVEHQKIVIKEIKLKISELFKICLEEHNYEYLNEKRTFNENSIIEELEDLIQNDINIGESDRARLNEVQSSDTNLEKMIINEKRLRKANEGRSKNKNNIDNLLKKIVKK